VVLGDHAKREIVTRDKPASSGRTLSRESGNKHKEESTSSIKSHWRGDKKRKIKKVVYYETDSSSPSEREIGSNHFLYEFWWLNCPTQIIGLTSLL
jgi:hypothetical protein